MPTFVTVAMIAETIFGWLSNCALHIATDLFAFVFETNAEHFVVLKTRRTGTVRQTVGGSIRLKVWHEALSGRLARAKHQQKTKQS